MIGFWSNYHWDLKKLIKFVLWQFHTHIKCLLIPFAPTLSTLAYFCQLISSLLIFPIILWPGKCSRGHLCEHRFGTISQSLFSPTDRTTTEESDSLISQILPVAYSSLPPPPMSPSKCIINCWEVCPWVSLGQIITAVWVHACKVCIMPRRWCFPALLSVFWFLLSPSPSSAVPWNFTGGGINISVKAEPSASRVPT